MMGSLGVPCRDYEGKIIEDDCPNHNRNSS